MRILVTGGAGFIGSHIVDALIKKGHQVIIIDNLVTGQKKNLHPKAKFYQVDIRSPKIAEIFQKEKPQIVYHCAAQINLRQSIEDPLYDTKVNILGSLNILQNFIRFCLSREAGSALDSIPCKSAFAPRQSAFAPRQSAFAPRQSAFAPRQSALFIFSSTGGAIYGETKKIPTPESEPAWPISPYGLNKLTFEKFLEIYRNLYGLNYVVLRYANVYGPRQNTKAEAGVIAIFIEKILRGETPTINGDGNQTRDYVYVDDVVRANLLFLENKNYLPIRANKGIVKNKELPIFNVGTGKETSVNEIFNKICQLLGKKVKPKYGPAILGELKRSALDYSKIKKLGWEPKVDLNEGLIKTINWFKNNSRETP